jgi:hypothetical protein
MAPTKRSNQPGAISQMYTSLASPDNRSVVTAVTFFVVSNLFATSNLSHREDKSLRWRKNRSADSSQAGVAFLHSSWSEMLLPP